MKLKIMAAILAGFAVMAAAEGVKINTTEVDGRLVDDINLPFVNDPAVPGEWVSVDFVRTPEQFVPGEKVFGGDLYMSGLVFRPNGELRFNGNATPWFKWTKGVVTHSGDRTAQRYTIKAIKGVKYMFFEWKSGDYSIRHRQPNYYVLIKK